MRTETEVDGTFKIEKIDHLCRKCHQDLIWNQLQLNRFVFVTRYDVVVGVVIDVVDDDDDDDAVVGAGNAKGRDSCCETSTKLL